jgi:hypothetical protein
MGASPGLDKPHFFCLDSSIYLLQLTRMYLALGFIAGTKTPSSEVATGRIPVFFTQLHKGIMFRRRNYYVFLFINNLKK